MLAQDALEVENTEVMHKTISISSFIEDFGQSLLSAVSQQNSPVYSDTIRNAKREAVLQSLKRKPFRAQQKVIHAVTTLLLDKGEKAAIINADMGTGKTLMGIAAAAIMHAEGYRRTLVISPPHLVYKWRREILETLADAKVWILNGPDALLKLLQLRHPARDKASQNNKSNKPEFFILGRVRMRMGFHWKPAFALRKDSYQHYPVCPNCGEAVRDTDNEIISHENFPKDKMTKCAKCRSPLWTFIHAHKGALSVQETQSDILTKLLCKLPTLGKKRAEWLLNKFGDAFIANMLSDNIHQFINLMDENGEMIFSDAQASRIEKSLSQMELGFSSGSYQVSEYIKRYLPKNFFSLLIVDETHEYKNSGSAQGQAMGVIASQCQKILALTGTLMGGYAEDVFHLLWRLMPQRMLEDGYQYHRRSLAGASLQFMEQHGVLKRIHRSVDENNHKTARGRRVQVQTSKAPGFGPKGLARYILPYTAFLKLSEIGQAVLPPYQEHLIEVRMTDVQAVHYQSLRNTLTAELKRTLAQGSQALLGVFIHCLLAWPDCCFREERVINPRDKQLLALIPPVLDESPSPKEEKLLKLCKKAKAVHQKVLVYTTYTGTRDTAARLKVLLEKEGFNTAVLRSSVNAEKREDWIAEQVEKGIDILICNPELTKTGLDLLDFPQIIFMQTGFNVYSLMQASRRSWRIGQKLPVNVYFLGYRHTTQMDCLKLMAKKMAVSQSTSGTMPETGLDILNQDGDAIEVALARQLIN
jgi:SNF2 family DNA or RNA helicase